MSFSRVLVPLDGSRVAENALSHAQRLVPAAKGEICLLYVVPSRNREGDHHMDPLDWRLQQARAERYLGEIVERLTAEGLQATAFVDEGDPAGQILEFAQKHAVDLIVFSAYGHGDASRFRFGGTVQKALRGMQTSIMIVRPNHHPPEPATMTHGYRRVLVPLDGSGRAEWAACRAVSLLRETEYGELILLQVVTLPIELSALRMTGEMATLQQRLLEEQLRAGQAYLDATCHRMNQGVQVSSRLVQARSVAKAIVNVAETEDVDLVTLSAHGASDESIWELGSIADAVASHCDRPVLILQDLPHARPQAIHDDQPCRQLTGLYRDG
ncbi:universal stress protein [Salinisphaera sp. SPP-AMP-43]|uniref:universal stress protein n=1 Tax=Salinisphaera sp. SPP-AMP-43 TaxID=3121288 RepID=UPI003C6E912C